MGTCSGKYHQKVSKSAQTELNPIFGFLKDENLDEIFQNYKTTAVHSRNGLAKCRGDNSHNLSQNVMLNDWKNPSQNYFSPQPVEEFFSKIPTENERIKSEKLKNNAASSTSLSGVWPINDTGDYNSNKNKRNIFSQSRLNLNKESLKSNLNINQNFNNDDDEKNCLDKRNFFNDINNIYDRQLNLHSSQENNVDDGLVKLNRKSCAIRQIGSKEMKRNKSIKKTNNNNNIRPKSGNNNSNNYSLPNEDRNVNHYMTQKLHSSNLLDQDSYPIQYTYYVDDNDICTKPFYDRRMVAIAKTCRCRIYFHAKSDETEKPLYYKGKPVRPVTITAPDMACLKRCLGSIDSQFPYFNCKAFLSLSN